ncbi:nodulation protein NfeD [bacterium]|nr:nodulation protein NfeD [bacterium]
MRPILLLLVLMLLPAALQSQEHILRIEINGSINPASAKYVCDAVRDADGEGYHAVLLQLNTPGGLLKATRDMVSAFLSSPVPVIVYVAPGGAQAASAGAFITMAGHIAAMAPGTNIGAAHPITMGEGQNIADSTNIPLTKATNDAAAFARTIAEKRGRNVAWAERAVRGSSSITETEALRDSVIDIIAENERELLRSIDGRKVQTASGVVTLRTADAEVEWRAMNFQQEILDILSDPNIAYILLMLGMYGLFFELYNPGAIFPGVVGGICLILAFYSMNTLPVNYAGLALIIFGVILFLLEIKIVSHGLLSVGGIISLFFGSLMLIESPPGVEFMEVSLSVIITVTACTAAFFLFVVGKGIAIMRRKPTTGIEGLLSELGKTRETIDPVGSISVHGEIWKARSRGERIPSDATVRVVAIENLTLVVEEIPAS